MNYVHPFYIISVCTVKDDILKKILLTIFSNKISFWKKKKTLFSIIFSGVVRGGKGAVVPHRPGVKNSNTSVLPFLEILSTPLVTW